MIDIQSIKADIRSAHELFLSSAGGGTSKITADYHVNLVRLTTKLTRVLQCFVEEGIIDVVNPVNTEIDRSFNAIQIAKSGNDKSLILFTNGKDIVVTESGYLVKAKVKEPFRKVFSLVDIDKYDWGNFSDELLQMIHSHIYERSKAIDFQIWGKDTA